MLKFSMLFIILFSTVSVFAQKDFDRISVRLLAAGKTDEAIRVLERSSETPNKAERYYVLAMLACLQGNSEDAFSYAKQAVKSGLPVERLQAGPREIFAPLYTYTEFKKWIKTRGKQLIHGPLLGSVSDSSASFWVRTAHEANVTITVKPAEAIGLSPNVFEANARTYSDLDYTIVLTVSGLSPDTEYTYTTSINGEKTGSSARFKTFPTKGTPSRFSVAFGGGAGYAPENERMWTTINKHHPLAFLLLGDNVYSDDPTHELTQRYCYYRRQSRLEWRELTASTSIYAIYDDHDFALDDCIPGPAIEEPYWKRSVWEVFLENWNNPSYGGGPKQPGCWFDFYIGDVHFIMLDGRYYRDLDGGSMLGNDQKTWLFKTLASSTGSFKVLVSPVPWSPGAKPGSYDSWDGFNLEREEIFSFIEKNHITGIFLMSADRHRSDFRKIFRPAGYDFYEVMSSRLTNRHVDKLVGDDKDADFIMGYNEKCSFGLLDFDTTLKNPQVTYSIISIDNEVIDSKTISLHKLTFPAREER